MRVLYLVCVLPVARARAIAARLEDAGVDAISAVTEVLGLARQTPLACVPFVRVFLSPWSRPTEAFAAEVAARGASVRGAWERLESYQAVVVEAGSEVEAGLAGLQGDTSGNPVPAADVDVFREALRGMLRWVEITGMAGLIVPCHCGASVGDEEFRVMAGGR